MLISAHFHQYIQVDDPVKDRVPRRTDVILHLYAYSIYLMGTDSGELPLSRQMWSTSNVTQFFTPATHHLYVDSITPYMHTYFCYSIYIVIYMHMHTYEIHIFYDLHIL